MKPARPPKPAAKLDEARKARLERIRLAVADGTYKVDGLAISKAIIRKSILR